MANTSKAVKVSKATMADLATTIVSDGKAVKRISSKEESKAVQQHLTFALNAIKEGCAEVKHAQEVEKKAKEDARLLMENKVLVAMNEGMQLHHLYAGNTSNDHYIDAFKKGFDFLSQVMRDNYISKIRTFVATRTNNVQRETCAKFISDGKKTYFAKIVSSKDAAFNAESQLDLYGNFKVKATISEKKEESVLNARIVEELKEKEQQGKNSDVKLTKAVSEKSAEQPLRGIKNFLPVLQQVVQQNSPFASDSMLATLGLLKDVIAEFEELQASNTAEFVPTTTTVVAGKKGASSKGKK